MSRLPDISHSVPRPAKLVLKTAHYSTLMLPAQTKGKNAAETAVKNSKKLLEQQEQAESAREELPELEERSKVLQTDLDVATADLAAQRPVSRAAMIIIMALWLAGAVAMGWIGYAYWTGRDRPDAG